MKAMVLGKKEVETVIELTVEALGSCSEQVERDSLERAKRHPQFRAFLENVMLLHYHFVSGAQRMFEGTPRLSWQDEAPEVEIVLTTTHETCQLTLLARERHLVFVGTTALETETQERHLGHLLLVVHGLRWSLGDRSGLDEDEREASPQGSRP